MFPPSSPPESSQIVNNTSTATSTLVLILILILILILAAHPNPGLGEAALEEATQVLQVPGEAGLIKQVSRVKNRT